jgi:fructoselysine 6-kinase
MAYLSDNTSNGLCTFVIIEEGRVIESTLLAGTLAIARIVMPRCPVVSSDNRVEVGSRRTMSEGKERNGRRRWVASLGDNTIDRYTGPVAAEYAGGNAYNVAIQLARAGVDSRYFGAVGDDPEAGMILGGLKVNAMAVDNVVKMPGSTALTVISLTEHGDRVFESEEFGVTSDYYPDDETIRHLVDADWVHIGMLPRADDLRLRLKLMRSRAVISQDCAVAPGRDNLDVGFFSAGEHVDPEQLAAEAVHDGVGLAVVTRGARGALAHDGVTWWRQDAIPTRVVDTTGAGDSFIAGFIVAALKGEGIASRLRTGAERASVTCQHPGGWPHPDESLSLRMSDAPDADPDAEGR